MVPFSPLLNKTWFTEERSGMTVRIAVAMSGGVDSSVSFGIAHRCLHSLRDASPLRSWRRSGAPPLAAVLDCIHQHRSLRTLFGPECSDRNFEADDRSRADLSDRRIVLCPVFMVNYAADATGEVGRGDNVGMCSEDVENDISRVRTVLDITRSQRPGAEDGDALPAVEELRVLNFSPEYRLDVIDPLVDRFVAGQSLNSDVLCNAKIKFGACLRHCQTVLRCDLLITGHYARTATA